MAGMSGPVGVCCRGHGAFPRQCPNQSMERLPTPVRSCARRKNPYGNRDVDPYVAPILHENRPESNDRPPDVVWGSEAAPRMATQECAIHKDL